MGEAAKWVTTTSSVALLTTTSTGTLWKALFRCQSLAGLRGALLFILGIMFQFLPTGRVTLPGGEHAPCKRPYTSRSRRQAGVHHSLQYPSHHGAKPYARHAGPGLERSHPRDSMKGSIIWVHSLDRPPFWGRQWRLNNA